MILYIIILAALCLANSVLYSTTVNPSHADLTLQGIIGLCQFIVSLISWQKKNGNIISPYVIFLIVLYIFSLGQALMYPLGITTEYDLSWYLDITAKELYNAQHYTLYMLSCFHIGALLTKDTRIEVSLEKKVLDQTKNHRIRQVGWTLFCISIIPYYSELISDMVLSISQGYSSIYGHNVKIGISNILGFISELFVPSIVCLFIAYKESKPVIITISCIIFLNVIVILITGARTNAVILIALYILLFHYSIRPIKKKELILILIGGVCLLSILSSIRLNRDDSSKETFGSFTQITANGAANAIGEMGSSMFCLVKTMEYVPAFEEYRYGRSYLYAFSTLIPNIGFWEIHPARKESNLGDWLTDLLSLNYGTGFSMCAEAYINFGKLCWLFMFVFGYVIVKLLGLVDVAVKRNDASLFIFSIVIFWFCLSLPRSPFIILVRPIFFYALPIYYLCRIPHK